ncbi:hypothetical protein SAMN04487943_108124 [Gracilibacillus orientalis]|uniref:Peptidase propeptide and YPEB domain-containing protein n=1 Tax=Gracilibacillus orientalis TaxID=334253 RepID=A0A1I4NDI8_9BACI|nr:hypothetical protein [Gracilibacillus orientalis]SFM13350.1 hypothetical protein SAMN04487943_108124 [Gracilibacillus orientalis]
MKSCLKKLLLCGVLAGSAFVLPTTIFAEANAEELEGTMIELEEGRNHTETIENAQQYIEEHLSDSFSGLYIDREEKQTGVVILMFTESVAEEHRQALKAFAEQPKEIEIREVDYTEDQLIEKQTKIDEDGFEYDDFTIYHTGVDIITGKVVVGIDPLNEKNVQFLHDKYGDELVDVVEGQKATTLETTAMDAEMNDSMETTDKSAQEEQERNFFQKMIEAIKGWFS